MKPPASRKSAERQLDTTTTWFVSVGGGHYGPHPFDNEEDAIAHYEAEIAIPSYMGAGHRRHGGVVKVTTIKDVVRP